MPPIVSLLNNQNGKDYIIGDVHGHGHLLASLLQFIDLKDHDRLFIVGDLFDRGSQSVNVFQLLQHHKNIFSVRGNHEDLLLAACHPNATADEISLYLLNGGMWILQPDTPEQIKLQAWVNQEKVIMAAAIQSGLKDLPHTMQQKLSDMDIRALFLQAAKVPELPDILSFVENLPYIIRVAPYDPNGFIICHADLLFSDTELDNLSELSPQNIEHLTWARAFKNEPETYNLLFTRGKRNQFSDLVYCGHSIVLVDADAIRESSHHINLDVGAYCHGCFIVVNHTDKHAFVVGSPMERYSRIAERITSYLFITIIVPKQTTAILEKILKVDHILKMITTNGKDKIPKKYQYLYNSIENLLPFYIEWCDDVLSNIRSLKDDTKTCVEMIEDYVFDQQDCCQGLSLFKQEKKIDPLSGHFLEIQEQLMSIKTDLDLLSLSSPAYAYYNMRFH